MKRIIISALCVILLGAAFLTLGPTDSNSSGTARKASGKAKPDKEKARANHSYARFSNKEYAIKYLRKKGIAMKAKLKNNQRIQMREAYHGSS